LNARRLAASIMCVEAQHAAALYLARGLAAARTLDLIAMEAGATAKLAPDAAKVPFPNAFAVPDQARPAAEGAVK
ncbi:MAG: ferritin-like domain-containing protein, partial [Acidimicrobiales bacterium]